MSEMQPEGRRPGPNSPTWDRLYRTAESQLGLFTLSQAEDIGYSSQHLQKHLRAGRIRRIRRGIYRLTQFPGSEHEDFVTLWLWSGQAAVFSHETSLFWHDLSDALPSRTHMTVPTSWSIRRLKIPEGVELHYDDLDSAECAWVEAFPVTTPHRAIQECIAAHVAPDLIEQAICQARQRGLISREASQALARDSRNQRSDRA